MDPRSAKPRHPRMGFPALLAALVLAGCSEGGSTAPANEAPAANPEPSLEVTRGETAVLDARAVDPDGDPLVVTWSQISGPTVGNLNGSVATFTAPDEISTLVYDVIVSDGETQTAPRRVVVWVVESRARTFWVGPQGSDSNNGTREAPFASITVARNAAAQNGGDVYIAAGTWNETVTLADGVSLYGGYDPTTWLRDVGSRATVIRGGSTAMTGNDVRNLTLDGIRVEAADGSNGEASIALQLLDSSGIRVTRSQFMAGRGGNGSPGSAGGSGASGPSGGSGGDAKACPSGPTRGTGASRSGHNGGGTGGMGGGASLGILLVASQVTLENSTVQTSDGGDGGAGAPGGQGGAGGAGGAGGDRFGGQGAGGRGGRGGTGGIGGAGGGGGGGPSIGIVEARGSSANLGSGVGITTGQGGRGGSSPGIAGQPGARADRQTF